MQADYSHKKPPGSGVLLPLMNTATVAIELYLKCLAAEMVYTPIPDLPGMSRVTASPTNGHVLATLYRNIRPQIRTELDTAYAAHNRSDAGLSFEAVLTKFEGLFMESRYPYERGMDITRFPLGLLVDTYEFLSRFVGGLQQREWIEQVPPQAV